jgi:hypothetical protein
MAGLDWSTSQQEAQRLDLNGLMSSVWYYEFETFTANFLK